MQYCFTIDRPPAPQKSRFQTKMAALFNSVDWVDEENDLSTMMGSGTRIASEIARIPN